MSAKVSIILPTFERAGYLRQSLDSLLSQTVAPAQILVVNDGSTDDTASVLAGYGDRITCIQQANGGKPAAINAALPRVTGDYIWIFDDDDVACADALERHLRVLERRREIGFTYSACYRCHDDPVTGALVVDGSYPVRPFTDDEAYFELLLSSYVAGPAVVVRTSVQRQAGDYRPDMLRSEDLEMATRWALIAPGARLDEPHPAYYRRDHGGARGSGSDRFAAQLSSRRAREFERKMMRDLAVRLDLRHYLPRSLWQEPLTPERATRARLRRWVVFTQKGMWEESLAALAQLSELDLSAPAVAADVAVVAERALRDKRTLEELTARPDVTRELAALLGRHSLRRLRQRLNRQLVYHARAEFRLRQWRALALTARSAAGLCVPAFRSRRAGGFPRPP